MSKGGWEGGGGEEVLGETQREREGKNPKQAPQPEQNLTRDSMS